MAMATLGEVFHNPKVFSGEVKVRKGLTARMVLACYSSSTVAETRAAYREWFGVSVAKIKAKAVAALTLIEIQQLEESTITDQQDNRLNVLRRIVALCDANAVRINADAMAEKHKADAEAMAMVMAEDRVQNTTATTTNALQPKLYTPIISPVAVLHARIPVSLAVFVSCCYVLLAPGTFAF